MIRLEGIPLVAARVFAAQRNETMTRTPFSAARTRAARPRRKA